jgi:hypothetical protein
MFQYRKVCEADNYAPISAVNHVILSGSADTIYRISEDWFIFSFFLWLPLELRFFLSGISQSW